METSFASVPMASRERTLSTRQEFSADSPATKPWWSLALKTFSRKTKRAVRRNSSGVSPRGRAVLVRPYLVEERTGGGLILPQEVIRKDQLAEQRAVVVEIGPLAWKQEKPWWNPWAEGRAQVGDRVLFSKWAGYQFTGTEDGQTYRVVNDSDIFMRIDKEKGDE